MLVTHCYFNVNDDPNISGNYTQWALKYPATGRSSIYTDQCTELEITASTFDFVQKQPDGGYIAMDIRNTGPLESRINGIYYNLQIDDPNSSGHHYQFDALSTIGDNGGLNVNCNHFYDVPTDDGGIPISGGENESIFDWYVGADPNTGILNIHTQGSAESGAGNTFTSFQPYIGLTDVTMKNIYIFNFGNPPSWLYYWCPLCTTYGPTYTGGDNQGLVVDNTPPAVDCPDANCKHFLQQVYCGPQAAPGFPNGGNNNKPLYNTTNHAQAWLKIYPIPTHQSVTIVYNIPNGEKGNMVITDLTGRILISKPLNSSYDQLQIDVSHFAKGLYMIKIKDAGNRLNGKLIVN